MNVYQISLQIFGSIIYYDNTPKLLNNIIFAQFVGIRRDLVSEPRRPDVYLAVNPVAFGSQLDDEIDENERCVFLLIVRFVWVTF